MQKNRLEILLQFSSPISNVIRKLTALRVSFIKVSWQYQCMKTRNSIWTGSFIELSVLFKTKQLRKYCCINISKWRQYFCILGRVAWDTDHKLGRLYVFFCIFASDTLKEIKAEESDVYSATKRTEATQTEHFETNFEISQSHVEMHTMKSHIIILIFPPSFSFKSPFSLRETFDKRRFHGFGKVSEPLN